MKITIYQVDAFTDKIFKGNPAAVCPLKRWLPDDVMQNIAMENNLSETAFFIMKENKIEIRWFTPNTELDLAGHPTLATAHVILKEMKIKKRDLIFKTKLNDELKINFKNNIYYMNFPSRNPDPINDFKIISDALKIRPKDLLANRDIVAVFEDEDEIKNIEPDLEKIKKLNYMSIIVTARGKNVDFVSRNFAPKVGIPEDPVTGSAHCELIPYWSKILKKKNLIAYQISKRGGKIYCTDKGNRVIIGGQAVTFFFGEINLI